MMYWEIFMLHKQCVMVITLENFLTKSKQEKNLKGVSSPS